MIVFVLMNDIGRYYNAYWHCDHNNAKYREYDPCYRRRLSIRILFHFHSPPGVIFIVINQRLLLLLDSQRL